MVKGLPRKFLKKVQRNKQIVPKTLFLLFLRLAGAFFRRRIFLRSWTMGTCRGQKGTYKRRRSRQTSKNSSEKPFDENITSFKTLLRAPPQSHWKITSLKSNSLNGSRLYNKPIKCVRKCCLLQQHTTRRCLTLENIVMSKWHWIQNQPLLREIFKEPHLSRIKKENPWEIYWWERNLNDREVTTTKGHSSRHDLSLWVVFGLLSNTLFLFLRASEAHRYMYFL